MVHLIKNDKGKPIGWEMKPTNDEEQEIVCIIRNLQFFGFNETHIEYDGISTIKDELGNPESITSIRWKQKKYIKQ